MEIKNRNSVCAVVVTFNRKNLLIECLESLKKQSRSLDAVVLVDNASKDATPELLKEFRYISELPPQNIVKMWTKTFLNDNIKFHYIRMAENTGGAGGFYEGIKYAFEAGYDWFWLMDDDIETLQDGLEILLNYTNVSKCIQPSRQLPDGTPFHWGDIITDEGKSHPIKLFTENKPFSVINTGCFEGMFIHRDIVSKIGFPEKKLFMVGDDTLYGWMASKHTKVICIKECCLRKKIEPKKVKSPVTEYLYFRNNYYLLMHFTNNSNIAKIKYFSLVVKKIFSRLIKYRSVSLAYSILKGYIDALNNNYSNSYLMKMMDKKNDK